MKRVQLYHDGWGLVKEKMIQSGAMPDPTAESSVPTNEDGGPLSPHTMHKQLISGILGSGLSPTQKMVTRWASHDMANFTGRLANNIQGYVDIGVLEPKAASMLFERTLKLESAVWPKSK